MDHDGTLDDILGGIDAGELLEGTQVRHKGPRPWTEEQDARLRSQWNRKSVERISYGLRRTTYEVRERAKELGLDEWKPKHAHYKLYRGNGGRR